MQMKSCARSMAALLLLTLAGASFAQSAPRAYAVVSEVARQVRVEIGRAHV